MEFSELYPALSKIGVTPSVLLSYLDDDQVKMASVPCITNEIVLELYHFMNGNKLCTYYTLWQWLASLFGDYWPKDNFPTVKAVRQSVLRLVAKLTKLKKLPSCEDKATQISSFLREVYSLPSIFVVKQNQVVKLASGSSSSCSSCAENEILKSVNCELSQELSALNIEANSLRDIEKRLFETRQKFYAVHRNDMKKLKRRDKAIEKHVKEVSEGRKKISNLEQKMALNETHVSSLKGKIDRLRDRAVYWKSRYEELNQASSEEREEVICIAEKKQQKLEQEVAELENENIELHDMVQDIMSEAHTELITFDKGKYTDDVRACCYELLSLNVGVRNVKAVIESVLKNIAHKQVDRLPQKTALCNMMIECLSIAQAQLGEELSHDDGEFYTLQTDGTTKYGHHFGTYDIATTDTTYRLGLRHVFSGSAQNTLETFNEILDDLNVVRNKAGLSDVSSRIISKVKNTMSDRHAAEKLFTDVLAEYRADILPEIVCGWESLSSEERGELTRMNNFFCGLHFLIGLANAAEETLKVWESTVEDRDTEQKSSGTQRLIRTACKAFQHRGSEQAGCSTFFRAYLRRKGITKIPLAPFVGNRFNILFYDAAGVFFLKQHMFDYLSQSHGTSLNRLLQAVLADLRSSHLVTGCRALGIVDKLITGPLWRYLQLSNVSILDMSQVYTTIMSKFEEWSNDAHSVVKNQPLICEGWSLSDADEIFSSLFDEADKDDDLHELLQLIFKSFAITTQRLVVDHLPGGQFHDVSDPKVIQETRSVPKTNVSPERDFAILDRLMAQKPNATYIALESMILFSQNKSMNWLHSKSLEERERLLHAARSLTSVYRANFRKRREEIEKLRKIEMEKRERELKKKRDNELKEKESLTLKIQQHGLWTTREDVIDGLQSIKSKRGKLEALKLQINFRRKVFGQLHSDKLVFQFSSNHRAFSIETITENLFKLLPNEESGAVAMTSTQLTAEQIRTDPELLIYRRIKHLFDCNGEDVWYSGTVLAFEEGTGQYTVAYDNEDDVYAFKLLEDLESGELIIL